MELKIEFGGQSCGVSIFLPKGTKPEKKAADELKSMMELTDTVERMKESGVFSAEKEHSVIKAAVTPDFHKGAGILLYDSPHNFIWKVEMEGRNYFIHRKGACSARGMEGMEGTPFAYYGEPVMIPGSMGSSSYLLRGMGNPQSLWSASHGAGRRLSRGEAIHGNDREFKEFMKKFHIVTPIDPDRSDLKGRNDILKKWEETIRSEAPYAYKDIHQVVKVHEEHGMAGLVARMEPVFTVKA